MYRFITHWIDATDKEVDINKMIKVIYKNSDVLYKLQRHTKRNGVTCIDQAIVEEFTMASFRERFPMPHTKERDEQGKLWVEDNATIKKLIEEGLVLVKMDRSFFI